MTQQEAIDQSIQLNDIIRDYSGTINYKVNALWDSQYNKQYETLLIPTKYNVDFEAGDYSIQLAFQRVSIKTLLTEYTTSDSWVSVFDIEVTKDAELNNYLNEE
jgi:hypothetical protein